LDRRCLIGYEKLIDPWYDYLAFPMAPLVLVAQLVGLFLRALALRVLSNLDSSSANRK
jgi:hypothetical protein